MSAENQLILDITQKLFLKKITFEIARQVLGVSERTIYELPGNSFSVILFTNKRIS